MTEKSSLMVPEWIMHPRAKLLGLLWPSLPCSPSPVQDQIRTFTSSKRAAVDPHVYTMTQLPLDRLWKKTVCFSFLLNLLLIFLLTWLKKSFALLSHWIFANKNLKLEHVLGQFSVFFTERTVARPYCIMDFHYKACINLTYFQFWE